MSPQSGHRRDWEALGSLDPLYAILGVPETRHGGWDLDEFFATGERDIERLLETGRRLGLPRGRHAALELGCGVGRLTRALAPHFERCVGIDISQAMIDRAAAMNAGTANCRWVHNAAGDLRILGNDRFDLVLSHLVLQHVPTKEAILGYVGELARVLAPGGLLAIQLPASMPLRRRVQPRRRLYGALRGVRVPDDLLYRRLGLNPIRMNWVPRSRVLERLASEKVRVLGIEHGWLGDRVTAAGEVNLTYLATRDDSNPR
jgi:SAM-dependent methyltransferase